MVVVAVVIVIVPGCLLGLVVVGSVFVVVADVVVGVHCGGRCCCYCDCAW